MTTLNEWQKICARTYGGGDYSHVTALEECRDVGDSLFTFLMIELSTSEGCEDLETAVNRLSRAVQDIVEVSEACANT